jgi:hypothetical protein
MFTNFLFSVCFGSTETPERAVLILKRHNRNKHLVSDSVETSFGVFRIETSFVRHPITEYYLDTHTNLAGMQKKIHSRKKSF